MHRLLIVSTALALLVASIPAVAEKLRCGRTYIRTGDSKYEVQKACGEPAWKDRIVGFDGAVFEVWVYELDWTDFPRQVTFNGAYVERIERLRRQ